MSGHGRSLVAPILRVAILEVVGRQFVVVALEEAEQPPRERHGGNEAPSQQSVGEPVHSITSLFATAHFVNSGVVLTGTSVPFASMSRMKMTCIS